MDAHPDFVQPTSRANEVRRFVEQGLRDISISRANFDWGVPIPDCQGHVAYVWLDALTNYISALGAPDGERFGRYWPVEGSGARAVHHVHAVIDAYTEQQREADDVGEIERNAYRHHRGDGYQAGENQGQQYKQRVVQTPGEPPQQRSHDHKRRNQGLLKCSGDDR